MTFSQIFKELCIEKDINIVELAKEVNIRNSMLYKYMHGEYLPTLQNLVKLANYFDCTINFLIGLSDNPKQYKFTETFDKRVFFVRYCELLDKHNISHYALSKKLNFAKSSYRNWKNGIIPYLDTLYEIAKYFDFSVDYLIGRSYIE